MGDLQLKLFINLVEIVHGIDGAKSCRTSTKTSVFHTQRLLRKAAGISTTGSCLGCGTTKYVQLQVGPACICTCAS